MLNPLQGLVLAIELACMPAWAYPAYPAKTGDNGAKKQHTRVLLFMNTATYLEMTPKAPIRRVLNAQGKVILDLDPAKPGGQGLMETDHKDSKVVRLSRWLPENRDSLSLNPQSRGIAKVCLQADNGRKQFFEIIVAESALTVTPGNTLRFQSPSKKRVKQIEAEQEKIVGTKIDPADPTWAMAKGLAQGFSTIRLTTAAGDVEAVEIAVQPEKIDKDKVLILYSGKNYWLRMTKRSEIAQVTNSNEVVLQIRTVRDNPESISILTLKAGFTRLELVAKDKTTETFAVFVVEVGK